MKIQLLAPVQKKFCLIDYLAYPETFSSTHNVAKPEQSFTHLTRSYIFQKGSHIVIIIYLQPLSSMKPG